jgi:competence protein ComEA
LCLVFVSAVALRLRRPVEVEGLAAISGESGAVARQDEGAPVQPVGAEASSSAVGRLIDPNTAPWWELAELPGIGEVKAHAIITYRTEFRDAAQAENPDAEPPPAFTCAEDLEAVSGIGPKTVAKMRPLLTFGPAGEAAPPAED